MEMETGMAGGIGRTLDRGGIGGPGPETGMETVGAGVGECLAIGLIIGDSGGRMRMATPTRQ